MKKFIQIFFCAALIFSVSICSAAEVNISNDSLAAFMEKCNKELKLGDPNSNLDTPSLSGTLKYYTDTVQIADNLPIKITYATNEEKIYSIKVESEKYDENVRACFVGLNIIFLKSLGLTDAEARGLTSGGAESEWQREGFVSRMNKRFIVTVKNSTLTIIADAKS